MFGPKKQTALPPIRLPKLPAAPGFDDISYLLTQAQKNRGRTVEMGWVSADRTSGWMLTVRSEPDGGEPIWLLYKGEGPSQTLHFSHVSGDLPLMFSLVLGECSGSGFQEMAQSETYASMPTISPPGGGSMTAPSAPLGGPPLGGGDSGQFASLSRVAKATLEGDLKDMQMPNLLQSIAISKMTGKLGVQCAGGLAQVYFDDGAPQHAIARDVSGDLALMELLTWEDGQFQFYPGEKTNERSIKRRLDAVLMEGVTLLDQHKYLMSSGLNQESFLMRKNANLSEQQFEQMVSKGAPIDMMTQKQFYQAIDNKTTLFEILRRRPMGKTEWIPIMFNLLTCDLVTAVDKLPESKKVAPLEAIGIDKAAIQGVLKNISRPETGLFTYPAFLYFLEQEWFRYESYGYPFALVIYELRVRPADPGAPTETMPLPAVREMLKRVNVIKRGLDILGHYETFDYGLLLPNTTTAQAAMCANRLVEVLMSKPLSAEVDPRRLALSIGVASIPEDCQDLGMVLSAAREAKNQAKQGTSTVILYKDLAKA